MPFSDRLQDRLFIFLSVVLGLAILLLNYLSPGYSGGGDTYNHYLIARFSWQNPELFLDYWGKPVYTVIASVFARFGMIGSVILNILCLLGSAGAIYLTARNLKYKYYFLAGVIVLFSPVFLDTTISSLTEPLCALLVALIVLFLSKDKTVIAALLAGFLPHLRSEGLIFFGIILLFLTIKERSLKPFLIMLIGSMSINILGWIQTGEPLWIITSNPYISVEVNGTNVCGSGTLWHYPWQTHYTFGLLNSFLAALSAPILLYQFFTKKVQLTSVIVLVFVLFVAFYFSHAFIWWQGMLGSCGYIRVMTIISPLIALLVLHTVEALLHYLKSLKFGSQTILSLGIALFIAIQILTPIRYYRHRYPIPLSEEEEVFNEVAKWYKSQKFEPHATAYLNTYFSFVGDINPYDNKKHFQLYKSGVQWIKSGDIVIWDAHFCPNEGDVPKSTFFENPDYEHLKTFSPKVPYLTLNDYEYEVIVFRKR